MVMFFQFLVGHSAISIVAGINSASQPQALSQRRAVELDDDVTLLQEKAAIKKQIPGPIWPVLDAEIGSYISDDLLQCVEGPWDSVGVQQGVGRATPWSLMYSSQARFASTCASQGYTELLLQEDECFPSSSRWARPHSPPERTQRGIPSQGLWASALDNYDASNNYPVGNARTWVACGLCEPGAALRDVWDVTCEGPDWDVTVVAGTRTPDIPNGFRSITPLGEHVCIEGQTDYMERVLANARTTPYGDIFTGVELSTEDCTARGYDIVRDMQNECWPLARTFMRSATESDDMGSWMTTYWTAINGYDSTPESGGLWNNVDWVSCRACEVGGGVRDRGLYATQDGCQSAPYTNAFCNAMDFPTLTT